MAAQNISSIVYKEKELEFHRLNYQKEIAKELKSADRSKIERKIMVIDLIIPTYKPGDKFQESLKRLALQTRKPDRIILVNTEAEFLTRNDHSI